MLVVSRSYYGAHLPVVQSFHHPPETPRQPPTPISDASLHWLCSCEQVRSPRRVQAAESGFEDLVILLILAAIVLEVAIMSKQCDSSFIANSVTSALMI